MKNLIVLFFIISVFSCDLFTSAPEWVTCETISSGGVVVQSMDSVHYGNIVPDTSTFCFKNDSNLINVFEGDSVSIQNATVTFYDTLIHPDGNYLRYLVIPTSELACDNLN